MFVLHHTIIAQTWKPQELSCRLIELRSPRNAPERWFNATPILEGSTLPISSPRRHRLRGMTLRAPACCDAYLRIALCDLSPAPARFVDRYTHLPRILDFGDGVNVMEQ